MADTLIAQGGVSTITSLGNYDRYFAEGEKGYVELNCRAAVGADIIGALSSQLHYLGVPETSVTTSGSNVYIHFTRQQPPLALIVLAIMAVAAVIVFIIIWKIWKSGGQVAVTAGAILAVLGVIAVIYLAIRSRGSS